MNITATEFKHQFGQYLETSLHQPVIVETQGQPRAVVISYSDYERFLAMEDALWAQQALEAKAKGHFLGENSLDELLRVKEWKEQSEASVLDSKTTELSTAD